MQIPWERDDESLLIAQIEEVATMRLLSGSPWSGVELLDLTKPLASGAWGTPSSGTSLPWVLQLTNGDSCGLITGAAGGTAGMTLNYGCRSGSASTPDMKHRTMGGGVPAE
jgi:hypothetical protein